MGARDAPAFRALGIECLAHLLNHLPHRHEQQAGEATIAHLAVDQIVSTRGTIASARVSGPYGRHRFEATLEDASGAVVLVWFNQPYLARKITPGMRVHVQGRSTQRGRKLQIANPKWRILADDSGAPASEARIRPVYPASEGLPSETIERAVEANLDAGLPLLEDHLPPQFRRDKAMPELREAFRMMHRPASMAEAEEAKRRLVYDELLMLQLGVHMRRAHQRRALHAPALESSPAIDRHIRARIPFTLTEGQERVIADITADLAKPTPANRLIQGDVGSGKTVVALYAMLLAVAAKHQAALVAPTEILAEQHFASISRMLEGSRVRAALLTGALDPASRASLLERIAAGDVDIVIGTHALLEQAVRFTSLGVAIIDEQHRFGVHQRARLREKSSDPTSAPHTIVMTATPIPRTLALTVFGDLDVSNLRGLPPGRLPVRTEAVPAVRAEDAYRSLAERIAQGEQAYVVVPAVDPSSDGTIKDVSSTHRRLEAHWLPGKRIAAIHGRLKQETRQRIMERFRLGLIDALVATTVIEVGVDVPNATVMLIEHADRFGLAQLHQLRGRVGRGTKPGLCLLVAHDPSPLAMERLGALVRSTDGFEIAEKDLEIRGIGELFGTRQAGVSPFRFAEFPRDTELLLMARRDAAAWIDRSPVLDGPDETLVRSRLFKAHGQSLGLIDIA